MSLRQHDDIPDIGLYTSKNTAEKQQ